MAASDKKEKILIALSDVSLSTILSEHLAKEGFGFVIAKTGEDALALMKKENPDLLLIDLILPGKNGYDVLNEKSFDRMITKIPSIIISNTGSPIDMRRIPSTSSVKDYIIKAHVDPDEVLEKVFAVFGRTYSPKDNSAQIHDAPAKKTILWIEDDKMLSTILLKKFQSSGYNVMKAEDGDQALQLIETQVPNIIITDLLLPGLNGFEIIQKIKMQEKFRAIPTIILSNLSKPSDIEKAKMLGVQKFLVKAALSLDEIVKEVASLIK